MNDNVVRFFRELYTQPAVENIVALPTGNAHELDAATNLLYVAIGAQQAPTVLNITLPVSIKGRSLKLIWSLGNNLTMQLKSNAGVNIGSAFSATGTLTIKAADNTWYVDIDTLSDNVTDLASTVSAVETAVGTYGGGRDIATDLAAAEGDIDDLETAVGTYAGGADIAADLAAAEGDIDDLELVATPAATQEVTVDTDLAIQAPDYALLTQINDADSDGKVIVVTPPAVPHVSRMWMCEVVAVGTTTVTVELGNADIASLSDGDLVVCMHNGEAWIALNNLFAAHA